MVNRRTPAPTSRRRAGADTDSAPVVAQGVDLEDSSADSPQLSQSVEPEAQREFVVPEPVKAEDQEDAAQVDADRYPERPYAEAVSDDHRAYLEGLGRKL